MEIGKPAHAEFVRPGQNVGGTSRYEIVWNRPKWRGDLALKVTASKSLLPVAFVRIERDTQCHSSLRCVAYLFPIQSTLRSGRRLGIWQQLPGSVLVEFSSAV